MLRARFAAARADPRAVDYLQAVREAVIAGQLVERSLPLDWTTA
jgi:hypothetical protein